MRPKSQMRPEAEAWWERHERFRNGTATFDDYTSWFDEQVSLEANMTYARLLKPEAAKRRITYAHRITDPGKS